MSLEEEVKSTMPYSSDEDIAKLIHTLKNLVPAGEDHARYLTTLMNYLAAIVNGDEIHQMMSVEHDTKYAKEALENIQEPIRIHELTAFRESLKTATDELSKKQTEVDIITHELIALETKRDQLLRSIAQIENRSSDLSTSIEDLESKKETLEMAIKELKKVLKEYTEHSEPEYTVEWNYPSFTSNHPIYDIRTSDIRDYLRGVELEYSQKMHVSLDEAHKVVEAYFPYRDTIYAMMITRIAENKAARALVRSVRLPEYTRIKKEEKQSTDDILEVAELKKKLLRVQLEKDSLEKNFEIALNLLRVLAPDKDLNVLFEESKEQEKQEGTAMQI